MWLRDEGRGGETPFQSGLSKPGSERGCKCPRRVSGHGGRCWRLAGAGPGSTWTAGGTSWSSWSSMSVENEFGLVAGCCRIGRSDGSTTACYRDPSSAIRNQAHNIPQLPTGAPHPTLESLWKIQRISREPRENPPQLYFLKDVAETGSESEVPSVQSTARVFFPRLLDCVQLKRLRPPPPSYQPRSPQPDVSPLTATTASMVRTDGMRSSLSHRSIYCVLHVPFHAQLDPE